jgi:hypothetical protein
MIRLLPDYMKNDAVENFEGNKLYKMYPFLKHVNKFSSLCKLKEKRLLNKNRLVFKQYIPLKSVKFHIKSFELCALSAG